MLTCRDVTELATDYEEGALSVRKRFEVRLHLVMCRFCRRYLVQMRAVAEALRRPDESQPADVSEGLSAAFREASRPAGEPGPGDSEPS
jgi:hypothetical protein